MMEERSRKLNEMTIHDLELANRLFKYEYQINDGKIVGFEVSKKEK